MNYNTYISYMYANPTFSLAISIYMEQEQLLGPGEIIGAKPDLFCEAIELVCGGSPKLCVLVEWKALDRVKLEL